MEDKIVLFPGQKLYRYDILANLPEEWNSQFHNPEYEGFEYGYKNTIGAVFVYDNEITAKQVLSEAVRKQRKKGNNIELATITTTEALDELSLLDLEKDINTCSQMLCTLYELGIDVATSDFFNHYRRQSFEIIRHLLFDIYSGNENLRLEAEKQINDFFVFPPYLGQLLTDFENGLRFKDLLQSRNYDGYVFMEEYSSNTYCVFDSNKLLPPIHNILTVNDLIL